MKQLPNEIGELRRSAVVSTFGPGAVVDFRAENAPVSVVIGGLEEWDRWARPEGLRNQQKIFEPRLQAKLGVAGFRLPPVEPERNASFVPVLAGNRFPTWLQCPRCDMLQRAHDWGAAPGKAARYCQECSAETAGEDLVFVVPVRFITACENGHLDEFPWQQWAAHKDSCSKRGTLKLAQKGAGLAGLRLTCRECGGIRSLEGVFQKAALARYRCRGRRPWLGGADEDCGRDQRVLQRGASNLYFPLLQSAIDIPPWSNRIEKLLEDRWSGIRNAVPESRRLAVQLALDDLGITDVTAESLMPLINEHIAVLESPETMNIRLDEYRQLTSGAATPSLDATEFEIRPSALSPTLDGYFSHVVQVHRLREVRVITGFTRIYPPGGLENGQVPKVAQIQKTRHPWLPAIEVRGEGVFFALDPACVTEWEAGDEVQRRADELAAQYARDLASRHGEETDPEIKISPRFVLVHTLAHVLIRHLALDCGYSTASLRERIYADDGSPGMAGFLVYTATPDADGTLGGLVRQGRSESLEDLIVPALRSVEWCSTDPLCIHGLSSTSNALNLAACHACVLVPETSCEQYNRFLDRAMLVGHPDHPGVGFFSDLLGAS